MRTGKILMLLVGAADTEKGEDDEMGLIQCPNLRMEKMRDFFRREKIFMNLKVPSLNAQASV